LPDGDRVFGQVGAQDGDGVAMGMKRQVSYRRRLREVMAAHGMFAAADLEAPLAERGIRLSLPVLAALCDIFEVTPAELIVTRAENAPVRRSATANQGEVVDLATTVRPRRARIHPEK
jgi:hypothetical protein